MRSSKGTDGGTRITPIDAASSQVYMVRKREVTGWKWWLWRTLWRLKLERNRWPAIDADEDEDIIKSQRGAAGLAGEFLAPSDLGIVRPRRMFTEAVESETRPRDEAAE